MRELELHPSVFLNLGRLDAIHFNNAVSLDYFCTPLVKGASNFATKMNYTYLESNRYRSCYKRLKSLEFIVSLSGRLTRRSCVMWKLTKWIHEEAIHSRCACKSSNSRKCGIKKNSQKVFCTCLGDGNYSAHRQRLRCKISFFRGGRMSLPSYG